MATNEKGILAGFSGKVGTVVGGNWKGVDYMRGKPSYVVNPQTEAQQNQRAKMGTIVRFLRPMTEVLRVGFKKQAVKMTAFNAATSYNMAHAIYGISPDFEIDYSKVMVSQGKLPAAQNPEVTSPGSGQITFTWEDNASDKGAMPNDQAFLVVVEPEKGKVVSVMQGNIRVEGCQVIDLPDGFEGMEVQCYIGFRNVNQTAISDSRYAGSVFVQ